MSKRSAQGPQGDKDTDLFQFNMSSTPDDKPQRATAAQMANRKIKEIRRRPRPSGTASSTTGASFGGPFNSIDPNTVSSTQAASQPMSNGFTFGQSQSFPGAGSDPKPPAQNGGSPFAFGSGGAPSTFNFSSSFGGPSTPSSNPFALNSGGAGQQPDGSSFSGFKGNLFNIPPSASQPPAQQPLPSAGFFGTGSQQSNSTGGLFSNTTTSGPSVQSGTPTPLNGNTFGQSSTGAPSMNLFAQSGSDKPNPFAQSAALGSESMQTSPDGKTPKPAIFGGGSGGFGVSTNFGNSTPGNLFANKTPAPGESPSKPLFGAKPADQAAPASKPLFGATQPSSSAAPASTSSAAPSKPLTPGTASPIFSTSTPKPSAAVQNPFQSSNLFGAPTPSAPAASEKDKETKTSEQPQSAIKFPSTSTGASLFSKSESAAPAQSSGLFKPSATGSLFVPKAATSTEQEAPKASEGNPFSSLFAPKPAPTETPKTEQKPLPSSPSLNNIFAPKPAPSEGTKTNEAPAAAPPASPFSTSAPAKPSTSFAPQSPAFSISTPQTGPAPTSTRAASQSSSKINGATPASTAVSTPPASSAPTQSFDKLQPPKMPSNIDKGTEEEAGMLYRLRLLNESFRREVTKLDPASESFDAVVQFYLRVRETIGAPIEIAGTKRKTSDDDKAVDTQPSKKVKPFSTGTSSAVPVNVGSTPAGASPSKPSSQPQLFGASQSTPTTGNKRKATEQSDGDASSTPHSAKRVNGDSTTANIFASSFSRSKASESDEPPSTEAPKKVDAPSFKPSTPESTKPALFSTTPTSSPPKPLFSASTTTSSSGASLSQAPPAFKPTFSAPTSDTPAPNPFVLKPAGDKNVNTSTPPLSIPNFGSGSTNFFAQFKAQSDKEAEKEKEKRKAEDFDSEEEDEAEWERKDAEMQRKKREELEAQMSKRAKFVPGQGFSFEEDNDTAADGKNADVSPASVTAGASVFDSKSSSLTQSNNIFGHLSATPSEAEENENDDYAEDTEEASAAGDDTAQDPSFEPTSEDEGAKDSESSKAGSKVTSSGVSESSVRESSDEGDFTKALKEAKQADGTDKTPAEQGSGSRSLFDRVDKDKDGNPKRQADGDQPLSSMLSSSKYASSFNSSASTPNLFASTIQAAGDKVDEGTASKPSPTNIFGAPTPAKSGASTPSIFGNMTKPGTDNTWKLNTPVKFATDSTTAPASTSKSGSQSGTPAADSSKPFSTLFGAPSGTPKPPSGGAQSSLGFSFGAPSQPSSSLLTPSVLTSATPSRASTPGVGSDTGAEESGDGDAAEALPQVDLARSRAGEENEDLVLEARARALKMNPDAGWESQGVGYARILKDRTTSRGRVLVRADPSGKVILNAALIKEINYTVSGTSVMFLVPQSEGPPQRWALRVKPDVVEKLSSTMEETKS